jgi:hypothetical protein
MAAALAAISSRSIAIEKAIGALVCTSLVRRRADRRIQLHRLVAQVTRLQLGDAESLWATATVAWLAELFPSEPTDPACGPLATHVSTALEHAELDSIGRELQDRLRAYLARTFVAEAVEESTVIVPVVTGQSAHTGGVHYLELVSNFAPRDLLGRADELAALTEFATATAGPEYVVLRGTAWSGKSALVAWFVLHPPPGIRVVSFFVTARFSGQSDRHAFFEVVNAQLTDLVRAPVPAAPSQNPETVFRILVDRAAESCAARRERLVLVVDGLDEDRGDFSIASALPARPSAGMRVIVSTRPGLPVPNDVPLRHPLRTAPVLSIAPSKFAHFMRSDAQGELRYLLYGSDANTDLMGLLAAAGAGLTASDLAELSDRSISAVEAALGGRISRSLGSRISRDSVTVHFFTHEELLREALTFFGPERVATYRQRIEAWAKDYRYRHWPDETPDYLLLFYQRMLAADADRRPTVDLVLDRERQQLLRRRFGSNAPATMQIRDLLARPELSTEDVGRLRARLAELETNDG